MRLRHPVGCSLDLCRPSRSLATRLEGRDRFQDVLRVLGLVSERLRDPTALDSFPCGLDVRVRDWRLAVLLGQLRADAE